MWLLPSGETLNGDYLESTLKNDFIKLPNQPVKKAFRGQYLTRWR
jgi:hypothetical protein